MEYRLLIDDFPIKSSICKGFSMAMLNHQRVCAYKFKYMRRRRVLPRHATSLLDDDDDDDEEEEEEEGDIGHAWD